MTNEQYELANAAFGRVFDGRVDAAQHTHAAADALWCRVAAQGRIVERGSDYGARDYRVHLIVVEHPALPAGEVYALFAMGYGTFTVYRCAPEDARLALHHPSAFNL